MSGVKRLPVVLAILLLAILPVGAFLGVPLLVTAATAGVVSSDCGPAGPAQQVAGTTLNAEQLANAKIVTDVTAARQLPQRAAVIALATVAQESSFRNITVATDHDSLGLFQQRVRYYGAAVAADPTRSTRAFLGRLVTVARWAVRPLTDVAAEVQRPREDLRGQYAKWEPLATSLTARFWPADAVNGELSGDPRTAATGRLAADCAGAFGTGPGGGTGVLPAGLRLQGTPAADAAVRFALAQLGKPYVWGGTGPDGFDCSGLLMAAWAHAGVAIPRVTYDQVGAGTPVIAAQARTGDLVFIPGSDGTAARPGHVGMVAGRADGVLWLVAAPQSGQDVQMTPVAHWAEKIVAIRRIR